MRFRRILAMIMLVGLMGSMGAGCTKGPSAQAVELSKKQTLKVWGVIDDSDAYGKIITDFRKSYPYVTVEFRKFRLEEYEDEILNALAEGNGPDIFMIHNTWVGKYVPKILPQPPVVKVADQVVSGSLKKDVVLQVVEHKTVSPTAVRNEFADAVAVDAIRTIDVSPDPLKKKDMQERVMGIPMSLDTLALYYNKDLLNTAGVAVAPKTWGDFQTAVRKLTILGDDDKVIQAGAGFGTGANVDRASDIITLLMLQNRTEMTGQNGEITFQRIPQALSGQVDEAPAVQALTFYTDFANPAKNVYTWNLNMPNSLDAFIQGTSAFYLGYSYNAALVRSRAPKMNLGITRVPQISDAANANVANYWLWTVSKQTKAGDLAWRFIDFMTGADEAPSYLSAAKRPAARRGLLEAQYEDPEIGVFASQVLTAKSWYKGVNPTGMENALTEMIDAVVTGKVEKIYDAVRLASEKVQQTMLK